MDLFERLELAGGLEMYELELIPRVADMLSNRGREGVLTGIKFAIAEVDKLGYNDAKTKLYELYEREASRGR